MSSTKYDLAVAYRIYPKVSSHKPAIHGNDKYKLAELCLKSFKASLGKLKVKMWVLLDGCPPIYEELFLRLWDKEDLTFLRYARVGDATTFREQVRTLMEQNAAEIVYLAEDDYFYLENEFESAVGFIKDNPDINFISPYNHPDIYSTELHNIPRDSRTWGGKKWNSCFSTTHTFLTTKQTLHAAKIVFLADYGKVSPDLSKWMALTKTRVFNPVDFLRWIFINKFWAGSIFYAWYYCWRQILFGKKYNLYIPTPSIATHMVAGLEAPEIEWGKYFLQENSGKSPIST